VRALSAIGANLVAVSSLTPDSPRRAAVRNYFPRAEWHSPSSLLSRSDLDLLVVATPPRITESLLSDLLALDRPCLIEKPATMNSPSLEKVLECKLPGIPSARVGYNRRFYEPVRQLKALAAWRIVREIQVTIAEDLPFIAASKGPDEVPHYLRHSSSSHMLELLLSLVGELSQLKACDVRRLERSRVVFFRVEGSALEKTCAVTIQTTSRESDKTQMVLKLSNGTLVFRPGESLGWVCADSQLGGRTSRLRSEPSSERSAMSPCDFFHQSFCQQLEAMLGPGRRGMHPLSESLRLSRLVDHLESVVGMR